MKFPSHNHVFSQISENFLSINERHTHVMLSKIRYGGLHHFPASLIQGQSKICQKSIRMYCANCNVYCLVTLKQRCYALGHVSRSHKYLSCKLDKQIKFLYFIIVWLFPRTLQCFHIETWPYFKKYNIYGTAKQLMDALPSSKRPRGRSRTCWRNYVEDLAWSRLGIPPIKLPLVAGDRDAW